MNKKIFSLLLVIFVLISLSAVSATELNDDKSIIYSSDDNAILSVDAKTFTDLSNDINGKDSITLENDYQYNESDETTLNNGYIDMTKDITIDGNGNGIYPTSSGKLFNISENVSVTIKNTIITGDGDSPLILLNNNSAVYFDNCKLINNKYSKSPLIGLDDEISMELDQHKPGNNSKKNTSNYDPSSLQNGNYNIEFAFIITEPNYGTNNNYMIYLDERSGNYLKNEEPYYQRHEYIGRDMDINIVLSKIN